MLTLTIKYRFFYRAPSSASDEAPDLVGYSLSNACGEECDVRQAMLPYGKKRYFLFSADFISTLRKGIVKEVKISREIFFIKYFPETL